MRAINRLFEAKSRCSQDKGQTALEKFVANEVNKSSFITYMKSVCCMRMHSLNNSMLPISAVDDFALRKLPSQMKTVLKHTDRPNSDRRASNLRLSLTLSKVEVNKVGVESSMVNSKIEDSNAAERQPVQKIVDGR